MKNQKAPRRLIQVWPLLFPFGLVSSFCFVYAGVRRKKRDLIIFGIAYAVLQAVAIALDRPAGGTAEESSEFTAISMFILWIVSTVHAFRINKKYRNEFMPDGLMNNEKQWPRSTKILGVVASGGLVRVGRLARNKIKSVPNLPPPKLDKSDASTFESLSADLYASQDEVSRSSTTNSISAVPVDVNTADLKTLVNRLNLSLESAERVLLARQANRGFGQIEDFVHSAGLKPHEFVKIRSLVTIVALDLDQSAKQKLDDRPSSGRKLDL
jgi:DNA uptake protein ComE-like DNA-binding protein